MAYQAGSGRRRKILNSALLYSHYNKNTTFQMDMLLLLSFSLGVHCPVNTKSKQEGDIKIGIIATVMKKGNGYTMGSFAEQEGGQ